MNNNVFQKNTEALGEDFNELKTFLLSGETEEADFVCGLSEVEDKEVLYAVKGEQIIQLDSLYSSEELLDIWMKKRGKDYFNKKYIFFGLGNGMYVRRLLKEAGETIRILVYEPSSVILRFVMENLDISDILADERFMLICEGHSGITAADYIYSFVEYRDIKKLVYQGYPGYSALFPQVIKAFDNLIQVTFNSVTGSQTVLAEYGKQYFVNTLHNLPRLRNSKSFSSFGSQFDGDCPVFIVSAGPSLNKNRHLLPEIKGRGIILAVDSAVKPVLNSGVIPDLTACIDGKKSVKHYNDERSRRVPIICHPNTRHEILRDYMERPLFTDDGNYFIEMFMIGRLKDYPMITSGGSVANAAMSAAYMMGFKNFILVGQDLAYTDNKTHAADSLRAGRNIDVNTLATNTMLEGIDGEPVLSSYEFELYRNWFEEFIEKHPDTHVVDATEGGALIHGSELMTLREAIDRYCVREYDVEAAYVKAEDLFDDEDKKAFDEYVGSVPGSIEELKKLCHRGIREYEKLIKLSCDIRISPGAVRRVMDSISEITGEIDTSPVMYLVQELMLSTTKEVLENVDVMGDDYHRELRTTANMGIDYLKKMEEAMDSAIEKFGTIPGLRGNSDGQTATV